ncbi:MAG: hypothetical protein A07HN63_01480 [uncultured archaeon A07HN63]|jgi:hypothetical protein|nr:MAG: hypothetical protein A07HN63_01480 [uncultured archaeon A07HN63]
MPDESTQSRDRIDTLFLAVGVALGGLSAVVLAATLYFTVGLPRIGGGAPALLGTAVFTLFVAVIYQLIRRLTSGRFYSPRLDP